GHAGKVKSGAISVGELIRVSGSGQVAKIKAISRVKEQLLKAEQGASVTIELDDNVDISRGDILVAASDDMQGIKALSSKICWLGKDDLAPQKRYLLQYGSSVIPVKITALRSQLNFESLTFETDFDRVNVNSINEIEMKSAAPIFLDKYKDNPGNGYFILVDEVSNSTVAVGFNEA